MESLSALLGWIGLIGLFADIAAWIRSREFRKERKRRRRLLANPENQPTRYGALDETTRGKDAWLLFLVLTPLLVVIAGLWALFKGWVPL
jgi:hypothetical protein